MESNQHPIVTKLAISLAGEMLNLATIQDEANYLEELDEDSRSEEEEEYLDVLMLRANCLTETTVVLRGCFLALFPEFVSDPVAVYQWALASFDSPNLSQEKQRALRSLHLSAAEDLGDYRTEIEKLPPLEVQMVDLPVEGEDPNLRGRIRQKGSSFIHRQQRRVHSASRALRKIPRTLKGAFGRLRGRLVEVKSNIQDRPHYRLQIVKID